MKFTKMQWGYFYILMAINPICILGSISFIGKLNGELFGQLENFLAGIYVIAWIAIVISFLVKRDKWIKKQTPKTPDQLVKECWDEFYKEKEENKRQCLSGRDGIK